MKKYFLKMKSLSTANLIIKTSLFILITILIFSFINPFKIIKEKEDETRLTDVASILSIVKLDKLDNGGRYLFSIESLEPNKVYMIGKGTEGCSSFSCKTPITGDTSCVNISSFIEEGYLESIPVNYNNKYNWSDKYTGYTLEKTSKDNIVIRSCESSGNKEIKMSL